MPEIFDLMWNFTRGSISPTATAFSVRSPRVTSISVRPESSAGPALNHAYPPIAAALNTTITTSSFSTLAIDLSP